MNAIDLVDHLLGCLGVETSNVRRVDGLQIPGNRDGATRRGHLPDAHHVGDDLNAKLREQRLAEAPDRDSGGGLAGARPFEDISNVFEPVLLDTGEVGVARAGPENGRRLLRILQARVFVVHDEGHGRADGPSAAHTRQYRDLVVFDAHPPATAVAPLATREFVVDEVEINRHTSGHAADDDDHGRAVRFA